MFTNQNHLLSSQIPFCVIHVNKMFFQRRDLANWLLGRFVFVVVKCYCELLIFFCLMPSVTHDCKAKHEIEPQPVKCFPLAKWSLQWNQDRVRKRFVGEWVRKYKCYTNKGWQTWFSVWSQLNFLAHFWNTFNLRPKGKFILHSHKHTF